MKKQIIIALTLLCGVNIWAQNESDVFLTSRSLTTGSARSVSLSNAMGAIGGDMSALTINPAGIAVYRSSEFSFSVGLQNNSTDATYWKQTVNDTKTNMPLNQIGFVSTFMPMRQGKGLVSSHFSFSYNRINNFNQNIWMQGDHVNSSMLDMWMVNSEGLAPSQLGSFGAGLAYDAYLINDVTNPDGTILYPHVLGMLNDNYQFEWQAADGIKQKQLFDKSGYGGEYSLTGGVNIDNKLLLGASLNFQDIRSEQSSMYSEQNAYGLTPAFNDDLDYFNYYENLNRYGKSVNFKIGAILKPTNNIRVGLAFHSPNYYQINEEYSSSLEVKFLNEGLRKVTPQTNGDFDYKINTPMKLVGSLGIILGERGFISADYEYQDYSSAKFKISSSDWEYSDYIMSLNQNVKTYFDKTHSFRVGGEYRATDNITLRAGYGSYGSPYKEEYLSEKMKLQSYSCGIGYRLQTFYMDVAYMLVSQNEDYYPYSWSTGDQSFDSLPQAAKIESNTHNVVLTLGWKF